MTPTVDRKWIRNSLCPDPRSDSTVLHYARDLGDTSRTWETRQGIRETREETEMSEKTDEGMDV